METKKIKSVMFVVRKLVKARSVAEALRKEKTTPVHEIFIDDEWRKNNHDRLADAIGFAEEVRGEKDEE